MSNHDVAGPIADLFIMTYAKISCALLEAVEFLEVSHVEFFQAIAKVVQVHLCSKSADGKPGQAQRFIAGRR